MVPKLPELVYETKKYLSQTEITSTILGMSVMGIFTRCCFFAPARRKLLKKRYTEWSSVSLLLMELVWLALA